MLNQSRWFNEVNEISGCLVYHNGVFLQYLEGPEDRVLRLYARIEKDSRHTDVQILSSGHIYAREFDEWTMAYCNRQGYLDQIKYLKFLTSSDKEISEFSDIPNPKTKRFWMDVKKILY